MKLSAKLITTNLIIVAVSLLILAFSTAYVAPENFSRRIEHMQIGRGQGQQGQGPHHGADPHSTRAEKSAVTSPSSSPR